MALLWDINGFAFRNGITWGAYNKSGDIPPQGKDCPACTVDAPFDVMNSNLTALMQITNQENLCLDAISIGNEPDLWYRYGLLQTGKQSAFDLIALKKRANSEPSIFPNNLKFVGPSWAGYNVTNAIGFFTNMQDFGPYMFTSHNYPYVIIYNSCF